MLQIPPPTSIRNYQVSSKDEEVITKSYNGKESKQEPELQTEISRLTRAMSAGCKNYQSLYRCETSKQPINRLLPILMPRTGV
ncbi:hypothetical protein Hanom_Chr17g01569901 [Helianthus anomalus]